jgi:Putative peptidoglycan binding domain
MTDTATNPEASTAAAQTGAAPLTAFVAPTTAAEFNTLGERLVPKACFKVEDLLFDFASSFIRPDMKDHLPELAGLRNDHKIQDPGGGGDIFPPLSIFGHADPVGTDDFNKVLSGRRATAFYAMLVRDTDLWETLFSSPVQDDKWGTRSIQTMLSTVQDPISIDGIAGDETEGAVSDFQSANGLKSDGVAGPVTRKALFQAYMDTLCGPDLKLDKTTDFLARNQDGGQGKGDFQGCSRFNPLRVFSTSEASDFAVATDKSERNQQNAPNRRVVTLLFAPGRKVNPSFWPCPRAKEGVADCRKRLFPDENVRRNPQDAHREFEDTGDTFGCRFYQIISDDSPCERVKPAPVVATYRITVVDEFETPLSAISVTLAGQTSATDSAGVAQFNGPAGGATAIVRNDKRLSDALAALVEKTPRDTPPPVRPGFVAITPSKANQGIPVAAGISQEIMIIARTDVVFAIPEGWEDLEPSAAGPWRLSKSDSNAFLQLVSQGLGRSVTLQSPAAAEPPFAGTFQPSPLWSPDHKRILQPGESLASLAEKYLGDASEVDTLVALNPQHVSAIHSGVTSSPSSPVTLPPEAVPGWLSFPQTVQSVTAAIPEDVFATIDIDALHDALFAGDDDTVWSILSALPRQPRNKSRLSGEDLLEIYTQSLLADLRGASEI